MKNIKYCSIAFLVAILISSCGNFLDEKYYGKIFTDTYPENIDNLENCVTSLYGLANGLYFSTGCFTPYFGGDDITTQTGGNKSAFLEFDNFTAQDNNGRLYYVWNNNYNVIKQANVIISTIDNIKNIQSGYNYTETEFQKIKERALGQAYFWRALCYFNLVRTFGEIPVVTLDVDYNVQKSSFVDIYTKIEEDLKQAESLLPAKYSEVGKLAKIESSTSYARITAGASKSLLASVYLTWAGYPIKDASKYSLAASKAKEVIDNESAYGYRLLPIEELWIWENNWKNQSNDEALVTCFYHTWSDWIGEGTNGNMHAVGLAPGELSGGWNDGFAEIQFFNDFPEGARKEATFITEAVNTYKDVNGNDSVVVKPWTEFSSKHPHYRKYSEMEGMDWNNMGNYIDWWSCRTIPVIRYAETLLIYAEAQAMADGTPNALAYECLNRVKTRANGGVADTAPAGLNGADFRQLVLTERKWEFAGLEPNCRWFDLVRTETVAKANSNKSPLDPAIIGAPNDATHAFYFAPIPQSDTQLNPNL